MSQEDRLTGLVGFSGMKVPVLAGTTAAITLSGEQTIDGVSCVTGYRVLVMDQADTTENGIYVVDTGDWNRAADADGPYDFVQGSLVPVYSGTTNGGSLFQQTTADPVAGTSALTFTSYLTLLGIPVSIANGGTGATTAAGALTALGAAALIGGNLSGAFNDAKTTVASAAAPDIWVTGSVPTGRLIDFTGNTGPVTDFADAPQAGASRVLLCASTPTFTNGANLVVPGSANYTAAAGDIIVVTAETTTKFRLSIFKADGTAVVGGGISTVPRQLENVGLSVAMAANAVTIALKGADGNGPSSSNLVGVGFRSATLTTGTASKVQVSAATSTAISSGSTGGSVSAEASRVWVAAILVAGAVELAWSIRRSGTSVLPIDEGGVITTVAEGGAGAADTAGVWYSTTQRTDVPFTIIGYFDSTQATAGTWASNPANVVVNPKHRPGDEVQVQRTQTGAVATGTTAMVNDDSIPQSGEGDQYMSQAITPTSASNVLLSDVVINLSNSAVANLIAALFQDSVANALAATFGSTNGAGGFGSLSLRHGMLAATTSATTLKVRGGGTTGATTTFNGLASGRYFGGVMASSLTIREIMA